MHHCTHYAMAIEKRTALPKALCCREMHHCPHYAMAITMKDSAPKSMMPPKKVPLLQKKQIRSECFNNFSYFACEKRINVTKKAYKYGNTEKQIPKPDYHKEE